MKTLHLYDLVHCGGGTVAALSMIKTTGAGTGETLPVLAERVALRTIGGYCDPVAVRWLRRTIRYDCCDVVHLHNFKHVGTAAIKAAKLEGKRVVWSCYDYWCLCPRDNGYGCCELRLGASCWRTWQPVKRRPVPSLAKLPLIGRRKRIMRWLNQLDAVICLSRHSEGLLREHGLTVPVHVVPLPITVPNFQLERGPEVGRAPNVVLYLGGNGPHKGAQVIAEAMRIVRQKRPGTLLQTASGSRAVVLRQIAAAACLVVPEQWPNPGPVVIAEAQLLGTPVVASGVGGIPEMGVHLCPPARPDLFAAAILEIVTRGNTQDSAIANRYDPVRVRAQLEKVYETCQSS